MGFIDCIKLYGKFFLMHLQGQMQYKKSFISLILGKAILSAGMFFSIFIMFQRYDSVGGFTFEEILLCGSAVLMSFAIAECFARGFDTFASVIGNGEFDRIMVRPRNEIFLVLANKMELSNLGRLVQAVVILIYAIAAGDVNWTPDKVLTFVLMVVSGVIVFSSLFLIYAGITFFTLEGLEFMNIFTDGGREFGQYPLGIYGDAILKFYTFIIPTALFQYYPLLYILERETSILYMLAPIPAMLFILPSYAFWRFGVRRYKSTGS